ncbi:MAG: hypothetical protein ACFWTN_10955 [Clostridium sp.]|jgi:putative transposase
MMKSLKEQVQFSRSRPLTSCYSDAPYEKIRMDGRVVSMAVLVVCGVNEQGYRDILAVEQCWIKTKKVILNCFKVF